MRRITVALAALGVAVLTFTGCSTAEANDSAADWPPAASCVRSVSDSTPGTDLVTVSGEFGTEPTVDVRTPLRVSTTEFVEAQTGEGVAIESPQQLVALNITLVDGETGAVVVSTAGNGAPAASQVGDWFDVLPGLEPALDCATAGTRAVVAIGPDGINDSGVSALGIAPGTSVVAVVDIAQVYLAQASGSAVYGDSQGLPTVVRAPNGQPGVIVPDVDAPSEPVSQLLIRGGGPVVAADSVVYVNFTSVGWDSKTVESSTWDAAPRPLEVAALPPALADALVGAPVGSQVMVVAPADPAAQLESPTVYVLDVLGIAGDTATG